LGADTGNGEAAAKEIDAGGRALVAVRVWLGPAKEGEALDAGSLVRAEREAREDARRPRRCSPATRREGRWCGRLLSCDGPREECWAAGAGEGRWEAGGLLGLRVEEEKWAEEENKADWAKKERRGGREILEVSFFQALFVNFTQTIKPCIRIMMHKHLFLLKLFKSDI
jgi:hypothetical protein